MEKIIKIDSNTLEEFLMKNKYIWNGVITTLDGEEIDTLIDDFSEEYFFLNLVSYNGIEKFKVRIDEVNFKLYVNDDTLSYKNSLSGEDFLYKDLSKDWIIFLLKKNKKNQNYRDYLLSYLKDKIDNYTQTYNQKNEELITKFVKIKKEYEENTKDYFEMIDYLNKEHKRGRK